MLEILNTEDRAIYATVGIIASTIGFVGSFIAGDISTGIITFGFLGYFLR